MAKKKLDPRLMMEKAVEVMRQSVVERRANRTPVPIVGAVLVKADGNVVTAARGELREGNHAEFILLERKCVAEKLDGSILFTTLEPCMDRTHPKRGCAKHIVSARVKEVYVGIEDDNPTVAGKGIEYLKRNGVTVHMFDRDLQEVIFKENKGFFEWARQQAGKPVVEPIKLSRYEDPQVAVTISQLNTEALERYRVAAGIRADIGSAEFNQLLLRQGLLAQSGEELKPTGFAILLFGERPRESMPQAGLLARAEIGGGRSVREEFAQALVLIPGELEAWLNRILPATLDRTRMQRRSRVDLPFEMIREAVVNALIHRDYDIVGEKCQLVVTSQTITVASPGLPVSPITVEQLQSFSAPMKSRNPILHYVFARMGMAEEQGFGLTSLKSRAEELRLPLPSYAMHGDSLVLTIYRDTAAATATLPAGVLNRLNKAERAGWEWLSTRESASSAEYAKAMQLPNRTALNHLGRFVELGLLTKASAGPRTRYRVVRP